MCDIGCWLSAQIAAVQVVAKCAKCGLSSFVYLPSLICDSSATFCRAVQLKDVTAKLEDVSNDRDGLLSSCKELQADKDSLQRERDALEASLASAAVTSTELTSLQVWKRVYAPHQRISVYTTQPMSTTGIAAHTHASLSTLTCVATCSCLCVCAV